MYQASHRAHTRRSARRNTLAREQNIRKRVAGGTWPIGYRLPTERELVQQFGLARNTLRKVMDGLADEGLITRHVGRGTFVAERSSNAALTPAQLLLHRIHGASPTEVRSEEHTSELQSLMRISYAVFCLKKNKLLHEDK